MALGAIALVSMLGAVSLAGRRRLMGRRHQLGLFRVWNRAHIYLGVLALVAVVAHSHGRAGGALTATLLGLTVLDVATGLLGLVFYKWMPRTITRIEGDAQVEEDVREELEALGTRIRELLTGEPERVREVFTDLRAGAWGLGSLLSSGYSADDARLALRQRLKPHLGAGQGFSLGQQRELERLADDVAREVELRTCLKLYAARKGWLALHIGASLALLTLAVVHVLAVLWFMGPS